MKPVEVVIACHSPERRLARAVASVLDGSGDAASVTVVAHNIAPSALQERLSSEHRRQVRWLYLNDGTKSPANPYNYGTAAADAEWVSLLGSDDYLEEGAVRSWLHKSAGADAVVARSKHDDGKAVHTPPVRLFPHRFRDPVLDRLYYRSAPLGLMRRSFLKDNDLAWDPNLGSGGDVRLSTGLWSTGRIRVQRRGPAYVIGSDANDRVTFRLPPIEEELAGVALAWGAEGWANKLSPDQRTSLAIKTIRVPIFGSVYYRTRANLWRPDDRRELKKVTSTILRGAPNSVQPLSRADRKLLLAILDLQQANSELARLVAARRKFGTLPTLLTKDPLYLFSREAPIRFMIASACTR